MKKSKLSDVPPMYRRNRKEEFINLLLMFAICLGATVIMCFLILL